MGFLALCLTVSTFILFVYALKVTWKWKKTGQWDLRVNPLSTVYHTTRLNHTITELGQNFSRHGAQRFYRVGGVASIVLMGAAACVLVANPFLVLRGWAAGGAAEASTRQIVSPVVPGVNIPLSSVFYLAAAVFVAGLVHELGHALAAVANGVDVHGAGLFVYGIFPGFFVDIDEHVCRVPHRAALSVFAGGVWHNLILCAVCVLLLTCPRPILFPLFSVPLRGVVTAVPQGSALAGHLRPGALIYAVNTCPVGSAAEWTACITELVRNPPPAGYCAPTASPSANVLPIDEIDVLQWAPPLGADDPTDACCAPEYQGSGECFTIARTGRSSVGQICLDSRKVITSNDGGCAVPSDCLSELCVYPAFLEKGEMVIEVRVEGMQPILFVGSPAALWRSVEVSDYKPRILKKVFMGFPRVFFTFLIYVFSMSAGTAVINAAPISWLDGEWIIQALSYILFTPTQELRKRVMRVVKFFTWLLACNFVLGVIVIFAAYAR